MAAMEDDLHIRPGVEADSPAILELLKASLGEGSIPRTQEYWSWKHLRNPFGKSPVLVAESAGRVVGLRVFMRWKWICGAKEVRAVRAVDTATHPDWQGRGIFRRLTLALVDQMKAEGVHLIFNTPNKQSRPGYLKMGWTSVGSAPLWMRAIHPIRAVRGMARDSADAASSRDEGVTMGEDYHVQDHLGTDVDRLWGSRTDGRRLSTPRSSAYLQWRYSDIPGFSYSAMGSRNEGEEALIIFRMTRRRSLSEMRFCEVLVAPGRNAARAAARLIVKAIRVARPDYAAAMAPPRTPERRALLRAGFLPVPRVGPLLTVRTLAEHECDPRSWSAWRASIGDLELF